MPETDSADGVIVLNPHSGSGEHAGAVHRRADLEAFAVRETEGEGDAADLAASAATAGASLVVAAGGDGTLQEVVWGVTRADALDRVTVGVVPTGTGNNFASNVGIESIDQAFAALAAGRRRRIDLAWGNDRPFVNSCVCGLTADASSATTPDMKRRLGVLAYVVTTIQSASSFDQLDLTVTVGDDAGATEAFSGQAMAVLAGNCRRFSAHRNSQADVEDGLLEVTVVEDVSALDLLEEVSVERLLGEGFRHATRLRTSSLAVRSDDGDPVTFSLDGEIVEAERLALETQPRALRVIVGDSYRPNPDEA